MNTKPEQEEFFTKNVGSSDGLYFFKMPFYIEKNIRTSQRICYNAAGIERDRVPKEISEIQRTTWLVKADKTDNNKFEILCSYTPCNTISVVTPNDSFFKLPFRTDQIDKNGGTFENQGINFDITNENRNKRIIITLEPLQKIQLLQKVVKANLPTAMLKLADASAKMTSKVGNFFRETGKALNPWNYTRKSTGGNSTYKKRARKQKKNKSNKSRK